MTDPDERTINRAISLLGTEVANDEEAVQDHREAARAALHRLFRDRRRLEKEVARLRGIAVLMEGLRDDARNENARLREALLPLAKAKTEPDGTLVYASGEWLVGQARDALKETK